VKKENSTHQKYAYNKWFIKPEKRYLKKRPTDHEKTIQSEYWYERLSGERKNSKVLKQLGGACGLLERFKRKQMEQNKRIPKVILDLLERTH
jgi:hypothetical protein